MSEPAPTTTPPGRGPRWIPGRATWRFFVELFSRREPGSALAWFRIAIGLVLLYSLLSVGLHGLIDMLWVDRHYGGFTATSSPLTRWFGETTPRVVYSIYGATLLGVVLVTAGVGGRFLGRLITFLTLHGYLGLVGLNPHTAGGYDLLLTNALWLLVLAHSTATHSVHCRLATGAWTSAAEIPAWPRYLAVFQLLTTYTATGLQKLSPDWTPAGGFSALFTVFQDPTWRRFDLDWTATIYPVTQIATAVTWFFEVLAPLMLLVYYFRYTRDRPGGLRRLRRLCNRRDLRVPYAFTGFMLHVGILVTMNVGPFSWVSLAYYICLWHPDEIAAAVARVRAPMSRRSLS